MDDTVRKGKRGDGPLPLRSDTMRKRVLSSR